ncbi:uncharacterized protein LOC106133150 isoform X2 [Amyelois transitella]|uniref:uncharacterized protein LOC106133150 isoform X2 n=1 Tax=Amyelois transitella TaxID=680683 RepID=UPI00298F7BCB|nr:uncharacterized protein LOC106133150 isoform X2 [Amyelois transitella]
MESNVKFDQSNFYHYKNRLSPIGQKIFDALINNFNKEQFYNNNSFYKTCERNYGQKRKVMRFDDSSRARPAIFSQNEPLNNSLCYNRKLASTNNRDIINDNAVGTIDDSCFVRPATLFQLGSKPNNVSSSVTSAEMLNFNVVQQNTYNSCVTPAQLLQINPEQNFAEDNLVDNAKHVHTHIKATAFFEVNAKRDITETAPAEFLANLQNSRLPLEGNSSVCRHDLLRPLDKNIGYNKSMAESYNENINMFNLTASTPTDGNEMRQDVSWSEMFDTELLPYTSVPLVKEKITTSRNTKIKKGKVNKNKSEKDAMVKSVKRKKELNKEKTPKILKQTNINDKQSRVRKEKYTKTVKKWLDSVDPNNPVDAEVIPDNSEIITSKDAVESEVTTYNLDQIVKDTLVPKHNSAKKIIQAQLANKGGIMKFCKPEDPQEDKVSSGDSAVETINKAANKVTVKKGKPKFIAPLKSQLPVKEVEFNLVSVDDCNWEEHIQKKQNSNSIELFAVLTYSNGFNQLNKQFTEDECVPDGVMLLIDEEFYYFKKNGDKFSNIIIRFLENKTVVCYDGKDILIFFKCNFDDEVDFIMRDVKIGGSLLEPDNLTDSFGDLQKMLGSAPQYSIAAESRLQKTASYLTLLRDCAGKLKTKLVEQALWSLFENIEMKVLPIIADMEFRGIHVNTEKLKSMEGILLSRMKGVESECHRAAGKSFQITSPAQVAAILYDELQLHTRCNLTVKETMSKGAKSTSEAMLRSLVPWHPLPGLILEYRRLHKAHATFLAGIGQHVKDGVLKPTWVQTAAATGRVAASNPNVQAIPKIPFSVSSNADNAEETLNLRSVYEARPGCLLLAADFKQVECRVFACAAADTVLLEALRSGEDLFTVLAAKWLNKPEQDIGAEDRERTKRIVYARLYGAGVRKLMDILGVSYDQALSVSASFDRTFPSLKAFGQSVLRACAEGRAPRTAAGRARPLPALRSADAAQRAHAQRQAINFLVQGTAADVCKVAMSSAHAQLKAAGIKAHLLLQIHDELVWEVAQEQINEAYAVIEAAMEGSGRGAGLAAALPVVLRAGASWGELHHSTALAS